MLKLLRRILPTTFRARVWLLFGALGLCFSVAVVVSQALTRRLERYLGALSSHGATITSTHAHLAYSHLMSYGLLGATMAFGALLLSLLLRSFNRRIRDLAEASRRLARGDFVTRMPETNEDEFSVLVKHFNRTAAALEQSQDALLEAGTKLEMRILERTTELQAANQRLVSEVEEHANIKRQLRQSETSLLALINSATDYAIFGLDLDGRVVSWNEGARRMYGYPAEAIIGQSANLLYPGRDWVTGRLKELLETARQTGHSRWTGCRCRQNGDSFIAYCAIQPVFDENNHPTGYCEITHDLTKRQEAEAELARLERQLLHEQKLQAIGTLASGISHDFNNIISVILGHAELIRQQGAVRPESVRSLETVLGASRRAAELVKQIQLFCRNEKTEFGPVDLRQVLTETASLLKGTLPSTISVRLDLALDRAVVEGNTGQLQQVLINLATNARDAMPNRTGCLTFHLTEDTGDHSHPSVLGEGFLPAQRARLSVSDDGSGMDTQTMTRIFDPFFTTKPAGQGTGLGLAVVDRILKAHQATCKVRSAPGEGTTFELVFSLIQAEPLTDQTTFFTRTEQPHGRGARLLLVDDEPELLESFGLILENYGYHVTTAGSGREALQLLTSNSPQMDLLITDKTMPGTDGLDLVQQVHNLGLGLPVILMSGLIGPPEKDLQTRGLVNVLLQKPVEPDRLLRKTATLLADRKVRSGAATFHEGQATEPPSLRSCAEPAPA